MTDGGENYSLQSNHNYTYHSINSRRNAAFQFNLVGELCDALAKIAGKYGTWLSIKKNRWYFIVHITCCIYWVGVNVHRNLWSQALFTIPTIFLNAYGFYKWSKTAKEP